MAEKINDSTINKWNEEDELENIKSIQEIDDVVKKYTETQIRVVRSSLDLPLQTLKNNIGKSDYINISPSFQRRGRWDIKKRSLLIESFLLNIPIPPIFLYENTYNQYEVMDGRQRIESIYEFLDNGFELTGLTYWPELNGMRFKELPDTIQRGLLRRTLNAIVLLTETNNIEDVDIRMILFNRLNTGGIQLNPHELRNAIYPSLFNDMLKSASRNQEFTSLWGIPPKEREEHIRPSKKLSENLLYQTMLDCELVLRYFGIKEAVEGKFKGSLRSILDKTMKAHQLDDEILVKGMEKEYINTLQILKKINGFENFIILPETNRYSRPLYDALTVACSFAISRKEIDNTIVIKDRLLHELCIPDKYEILVGRGNSLQSIKERVKLAYNIITNKVFI